MLVNLLIVITEYWQVSLSGHLFDQFLINEALDIIESAGGSFHLVNCHVGQSVKAVSFSELEVSSPVFRTEIFTYVPLKMFFLFISHSSYLVSHSGEHCNMYSVRCFNPILRGVNSFYARFSYMSLCAMFSIVFFYFFIEITF